jgi:hypothetical protein
MDGVVEDVLVGVRVLLLGLDQDRVEAASEHVVAAPVALVEGARVGAVQVAHAVGEVRRRRLDDEVVVVSHQAANVDAPAVTPFDAPENVGPDDPVPVVEDDRELVVPACRDVVDRAGREVAAGTAHPVNLAGEGACATRRRVSSQDSCGPVTCQAPDPAQRAAAGTDVGGGDLSGAVVAGCG